MKKLRVAWTLFAKTPVDGFVKTRISEILGNKATLAFYELCLKWQWDNFKEISEHKNLAGFPDLQLKFSFFVFTAQPAGVSLRVSKKHFYKTGLTRSIQQKKIRFVCQEGRNLGERLVNAALKLKKDFDLIVVWGSDAVALTVEHLKEALLQHDLCCIIPAHDGGYNLITIKADVFREEIFHNVLWSSAQTFNMQKKQFDDLNIPLHIMNTMPDVDTPAAILRTYLYMKEKDSPIYQNRIKEWSLFWKKQELSLPDEWQGVGKI